MNELMVGFVGSLGLLISVIAALAVLLYLVPIPLWIAAWASGAYVGLFTLIAMRLRRVPPAIIVTARISAVKAGIELSINDLEAHFLAGGNVTRVVNAMISADKANIPLPFQRAAAIDLAGRNVLEAVQMSVIPKVIETPRIAAVAKDGIQLIAVSRVTVRTNIDRLVGGAGEETIMARVGEGMVSTIGSAISHKHVLENPDHISKHILSKGLDAGTAYEILSIDIADVDVGENIGAKLQIDQANADKQIAQAKAEERRAMAVALEQEMRARVVEAEAEVPRAMAEAFRAGNLGIMDYYRMKNMQADTAMREEIASTGDEPADGRKKYRGTPCAASPRNWPSPSSSAQSCWCSFCTSNGATRLFCCRHRPSHRTRTRQQASPRRRCGLRSKLVRSRRLSLGRSQTARETLRHTPRQCAPRRGLRPVRAVSHGQV